MIDFRSDTVTKPSKAMLDAMFSAPVGDDVFEEDPTINELQDYTADLFGMEAALYCSSGTQTNQIAINVHVDPGGEVITHVESHIYKYEGGGIARNSGASVRLLDGNRGRISVDQISPWINNPDDVHFPLTQLISLEDTSNRGGGAIYDFNEIKKIRAFSLEQGLPLHLDGARLMNAMVENGVDMKEYASQFDSISLCLSKGLGAPVGSLLIGKKDFIKKARRVRKVFGGGMRQAGIIAAGGLYAMKNNVERLREDHENARALESTFNEMNWVDHVLGVDTNIVVVVLINGDLRDPIIAKFNEKGMAPMPFGPGMIRFVTHLDISKSDIDQTIQCIRSLNV
ncbi:MAG: low-specificity L-threonine aldolase [Crocinitomicaceae bacterium]|nr:low-specificity L-threonine aldolase [Flavobacteriales bacterium]NQZ35497.1 low-specificity L-threonine aldolase [Crocinitomicaceae bacterium]